MPNPDASIIDEFTVDGTPPPGWAKTDRDDTTGEGVQVNADGGTCRLTLPQRGSIYWTDTEYEADCEVWFIIGESVEFAVDSTISILLRIQNAEGPNMDGYEVRFLKNDEGTHVYLYRIWGNVLLAGPTSLTIPAALDDRLWAKIIGNEVSVYERGDDDSTYTLVDTFDTDSAVTDGGHIGLEGDSTGTGDDYNGVYTVGAGNLVPPDSVTIAADSGNSGLVAEEQTFTATVDGGTPPITITWSTDGLVSGQGTATAVYSWCTTCDHTITVTASNPAGEVTDTYSVDLDLTYMQIAEAIKTTVEDNMSADLLSRAYGYDELPEGIQDYGSIMVHWQSTELPYTDTDRHTFEPFDVPEILFYLDYVQSPRNHLAENNAALTEAASELHNIIANESAEACNEDGQCPPFGLCALKNFTWRAERVILDYGGVLYYAARFEIRIRIF